MGIASHRQQKMKTLASWPAGGSSQALNPVTGHHWGGYCLSEEVGEYRQTETPQGQGWLFSEQMTEQASLGVDLNWSQKSTMPSSLQRPDERFAAVWPAAKGENAFRLIEIQPVSSPACCLSTVCSAVRLGVCVRAMGRDKSIKRPVSLRRSALFILSVRERRGRERDEGVMWGEERREMQKLHVGHWVPDSGFHFSE